MKGGDTMSLELEVTHEVLRIGRYTPSHLYGEE